MELSGKISQVRELMQGEGKNGPWKKQEYIVEIPGNYPKKVCVTIWGDRIDEFALKEGEDVILSIDIESREYNGRWYTDVKAWKAERSGASAATPGNDFPENASFSAENEYPGGSDDDLPF